MLHDFFPKLQSRLAGHFLDRRSRRAFTVNRRGLFAICSRTAHTAPVSSAPRPIAIAAV